jgi:hypothetical protein
MRFPGRLLKLAGTEGEAREIAKFKPSRATMIRITRPAILDLFIFKTFAPAADSIIGC